MVQRSGIASALHWSLGPATLGVGALARRAIARGVEVICGLRGHETVLHFGERRLSLKCVACGYQTPGWGNRTKHSFRASVHAERYQYTRVKADRLTLGVSEERPAELTDQLVQTT